jgi:hypothetical protein
MLREYYFREIHLPNAILVKPNLKIIKIVNSSQVRNMKMTTSMVVKFA